MPRPLTPFYQTMLRNVRRPGEPIITGVHKGSLGAWATDLAHAYYYLGTKYAALGYKPGDAVNLYPDSFGAADFAWPSAEGVRPPTHDAWGPVGANDTSLEAALPLIPQPWALVFLLGAAERNPEALQRNVFVNGNVVLAHHRPAAGVNRFFFFVGANQAEVYPQPGRPHWFICRRIAGETRIETDEGEIATVVGADRSLSGAAFLGVPSAGALGWVGDISALLIYPVDVYDKWPHLAALKSWLNAQLPLLPGYDNLWNDAETTSGPFCTVADANVNVTQALADDALVFHQDTVLTGRRVQMRARADTGGGQWKVVGVPSGAELVAPQTITPDAYEVVEFDMGTDPHFEFRAGPAGIEANTFLNFCYTWALT